ncbi:hypothetical protein MKC76_03655 [[Clostridium] innocuum]|nr:hypothetical protein [[Clostridium] innocuum]MCR0443854.1 hypothetical protein [[Clostridium] innocuum]
MEQASVDIKRLNQKIIDYFLAKKATTPEKAIAFQNIQVDCNDKLKLILLNEFVKNDFMAIVDKKFYFQERKYNSERKKVYTIYFMILAFPFIIAILFMIYKI